MSTFFETGSGSANEYWVAYLASPTTGTHNVVANWGRSTIGDVDCFVVTGAAQTGFPDAHGATYVTSATSASSSLTTVANDALVIDVMYSSGDPATLNFGTGQTQLIADHNTGGGNTEFSSHTTNQAPGSINTSASWSSSVTAIYGNFSIAPAP
jgi:hypothetical protein